MKRGRPKKKSSKQNKRYEDYVDVINEEIDKKRYKWNLTALAWMDYDDVSQILRFHIFKKWHLFDQDKNIKPWIRTIIANQIKNLIRNNYTNFIKPCNKCEAAKEGSIGCEIYGKQCSDCPLYKNWEKNKKAGVAVKMAMPLETHKQEAFHVQNNPSVDIERSSKILHDKMEKIVKASRMENIYFFIY